MTVKQVIDKRSRYNNIDISEELGLDWLNLFQQDLAFDGGPVDSFMYESVVKGVSYNLPDGFVSFLKAVTSDGKVLSLDAVTIERTSVKFGVDADGIDFSYVQVPPTLLSASDPLTVNIRYHDIAYLYMLAMYYDMEGEGDPEESGFAERYYQRYEFKKHQITSELQTRVIEPVGTTDVLPRRRGRTVGFKEFY